MSRKASSRTPALLAMVALLIGTFGGPRAQRNTVGTYMVASLAKQSSTS
jgi:hypothetical protein